jgi:hypothetical protein
MTTVNTTMGPVDDSLLRKSTGGYENDNEKVTWVEYRTLLLGTLVHRSASVYLKLPTAFGNGAIAQFG